MTIWETLFGTPERTAKTLDYVDQIDACYFMTSVHEAKIPPERCEGCLFDYDHYVCGRTDMTLAEWLNQEMVE
jgi:hypothetical protein